MTQARLLKFKFKKDQKQTWFDWCQEAKQRVDEILQTMQVETLVSESCFFAEQENAVYYFMEAEDFERAREAMRHSNFSVDVDYKKAVDTSLEFVSELENLFHFSNR